jgi:hypothetical protein
MANTTLNLYHGGLWKVRKVEWLETVLTKDKITYHGSAGDVGTSMSILGSSTS